MVLTKSKYDEIYYQVIIENGIRKERIAGYTDYLELQCNWVFKKRYEDFLTRHNILTTDRILELGGAVGYFKKVATELGYDITSVDWSAWCKQNELSSIIEQDALSYLQAQPDNSFDVIVSFTFLECFTNAKLVKLYLEMKRVGIKQIHQIPSEDTTNSYNLKTIVEYQSLLPDDTVIEFYG